MAITLDGSDNKIAIGANATGSSAVRLYEDTDNGTNYVDIIAPSSITSNRTLTLPDATGTLLTNSGTEAGAFSTLSVNSNNISAENSLGFRNRIINGDMRIDQRNAGASVTASTTGTGQNYTLDRFFYWVSQASKMTIQQNAGSVTPPAGFTNYLGVTSSAATSLGSSDYFLIGQAIEGFNTADLDFGKSTAKTVTLSFWVRSSLTGTFGGALQNYIANRSYPFSYTISSANTWEQKSITITGDTGGTWIGATNGIGAYVWFGLGLGSNFSGTAGAWSATSLYSATGATSVVGTNGATWYITGVQLEVGSVATPFERRDYGRELMMCQRYYSKSYNTSVVPGTANSFDGVVATSSTSTAAGGVIVSFGFPVEMRASPTMTFYSGNSGTSGVWRDGNSGTDKAIAVYLAAGTRGGSVYNSATWSAGAVGAYGHWVAAIEL